MGLPANRSAESRGFDYLRSNWMSRLWLVAAILLGLLLWQQIVGWPVHRRYALGLESPVKSDGSVFEVRLRLKEPLALWDEAFVRVGENGTDLPRLTTLPQLDTAPGWYIKGRSIYLHPRDDEAKGKKALIASLPWSLTGSVVGLLVLIFAIWTGALIHCGNTSVRRFFGCGEATGETRSRPWPGLVIAAGILFMAIALRTWGFSFPEIYSDTKDYLRPALEFAAGGHLTASPDRPFAYPLTLGLLLRFAGDFRAVVFVQAVATLLTGAIVCALLWFASIRLFGRRCLRASAQIIALILFALFCLNETILQREWAILPEAWATIYMGLQLWLAWTIVSRDSSRAWLIVRYIALCLFGCLLFFTKPNWGMALAALPIPLVIAGAMRVRSRRELAGWIGAGIGIPVAITAIAMTCQFRLTPGSAVGSLDQRSRVLICWHAPMVRLELARRLQEAPEGPNHEMLAQVAQVLDKAFALAKSEGPGAYPTLGYDADRLFYIGMKEAELYQKMPRPERTAIFNEIFWSALRRHPGMYVEKVVSQFFLLFTRPYGPLTAGPRGPAVIDRNRVLDALDFSENFAAHFPDYVKQPIREHYSESLQRAKTELAGPWPSRLRYGLSMRISLVYDWLRRPFAWMIFLPMTICIAATLRPNWRKEVPWRKLAPVFSAALWASVSAAFCAFTSSIAQALEIQRYIDLFQPLTLFAQFVWPVLGLSVLISMIRNERQNAEPPTTEQSV